ncbi:HVO_0476 family zinc finger protein [Halomarina ordinaria]|uniref:HVO_0476 family zinc finger protein n=1 Tax=Halomarina ordinaria TaxID=3033939 RepID=A0ABD5U8G5_9EURY|nr:HVO_0476 family zinc finger protein [Halomarina sp. PSRA2]
MSQPGQQVAVACPACSPDVETVHEVLSPGGTPTVRCTECGHTHKTELEEERTVERDVIVSQDGESFKTRVEAPAEETVAAGEEFIVDTDEALMTVRITSLEVGEERRSKLARVEEVETFWTRAVDNVHVPVTLNPKEGGRDDTRSLKLLLPGDQEFVVGQRETFGDEEFTVKSIRIRDDARGYDFWQLDHDGDSAVAKDVKRVYGDDETSDAWSAW